MRIAPTWLLGGVLASALSCAGAAAQGLGDIFMASPEQEQRIGAAEHPKILAEFGGAYDDPELAAYVTSIGQFLALTSEASATAFTFTVLNSPVVNAFALPGGYVYVTRGLVALAENEAELAGVLAHEIGHVAARHGAQRQGQGTLATLGLLILGVATDSAAAVNLGQLGASAILSSYSREDEYEADTLGVQYLSRAGFSPGAMSSFLKKLEAHHQLEGKIQGTGASEGFGFFATHPRTGDRVERAIQNAGAVTVSEPIVAQDIYYRKINGMVYGDDPAQGVVRGRRFLHPVLGFEFSVPPGFNLLNGQTSVIAKGPDGAGIKFDMDRSEGVGSMTDYLRRRWAPQAPLTNLEPVYVNGMQGATAMVEGVQGGKADVRLFAVRFDGRIVYRFLFVIPAQIGASLDAAYRRTAFSFKRLAADEASRIRPHRLVIREVRPGDTVYNLAEQMPFPDYRLERFLDLNGMTEASRLVPGQHVKLVVD